MWRRFDEVLTFPLPTVHELRRLLRLRLRRVRHHAVEIDKTASALRGLPHAAVDKLVADAQRTALLRGHEVVLEDDIRDATASVTRRPW